MKFKKLKLYTNQLESELKFYSETMGFPVLHKSINTFTVKVGWSELTFEKSDDSHKYHYCFLIPANQLIQALQWMEMRTEVIEIESGRKTQHFESWNADSFYFYDGSGNVAEFIVRYDLKNNADSPFDISKVLSINEMGMPSNKVSKINEQLENELQTKFWKGDLDRFATNGTQEGIWLIPNYELKDIWFPTSLKITPEPLEAIIEHDGKQYQVEYKDEQLLTTEIA
ncbi:VOC family protein [Portibacter lacus]|uniref:Glyoxalase n=1 Tax=Portibacter lacus TaxID=1099794 RepID=A0AA37SP29_9BACT|nr:hypothetical protein [Portibacter lacus]GLR15425.1 hypothetical protein GCM10007940_00400 [Portibacter lacus]